MVITSQRMSNAVGLRKVPGGDGSPGNIGVGIGGLAIVGIVEDGSLTPDGGNGGGSVKVDRGGGAIDAVALGDLVLSVGHVVRATSGEVSRRHDGNVLPWGRMPIRIVVTFLIALPTTTTAVVLTILSGGGTNILVGNVQSTVTMTSVAIPPEIGGFVLNKVQVVIVVIGRSRVGGTVTNPGAAEILENHLAVSVQVTSTATVLRSPLNLEKRAFIVGHFRTPTIASISVVLRVEGTVLVVGVTTIAVV
jgi:hypothetical protein